MLLRFPRSYRWSNILDTIRYKWPRILCYLLIFYIVYSFNSRKHPFIHHAHTITPSSISFISSHLSPTSNQPVNPHLSPSTADTFCRAHRFSPFLQKTQQSKRKIYDLFLLNTELDWLEIRLSTLSPTVDYFIIVESPITFTGHPKSLLLQENWARFAEYHDKIIHHVLENPPMNAKRTWDIEDYQRNAMFIQTFPKLSGEKEARRGDIIVVSDVDEIPRPAMMVLLRNCDVPRRVTIRSVFYYYGFMWRHVGPEWKHGQATIYTGDMETTILPADLRNREGGAGVNWFWSRRWWESAEVWNAGWHCSSCFESVEDILGKMGSFSHTGLNQEAYRDRQTIVENVREGKDLWNRKGESFIRIDKNEDLPEPLKEDRKRWSYLLDRDGENAGFVDYHPDEKVG